ncbi:MAG: AmmeMemoRadiSam system radical SAM enzyme [Armatimonadota bacterium]|nr:AmmeMemoRadiSam system radical SAM enzyme [Armatimonadota bacterium]
MAIREEIQLHKAILYDKLPDNRVKCNVCQRRCTIAEGKMGVCLTRINKAGELYSTIYGIVSSMHADPIEKKPVYHYLPGSLSMSFGSFGCNFRCVFCQNWEIAYANGVKIPAVEGRHTSPKQAVDLAKQYRCASISWTYNEPAIWLEYTLDSAKLAKENGLHTIYVTNGYATPEHLDLIGPYLDVYRVDIKSFDDNFYRKLINVPSVQGILEVTKLAKEKWHMHVETVTNIIPTWNDAPENLRAIARWIKENLGELTPWHVTRFFPCAELVDVPPTPLKTLELARDIGYEEGLKFVYIGNVAASGDPNTRCPDCGAVAVWRFGYRASVENVTPDGRCSKCGRELGIVVEG